MKKKLIEFFTEANAMGELLLEIISRKESCYGLAKFLVDYEPIREFPVPPTIEYTCIALGIEIDQLEILLLDLKKSIDGYFINNRSEFDLMKLPFLNHDIMGTMLLFHLDVGDKVVFKTNRTVHLEINSQIFPIFLKDYLKGKSFKVTRKSVKIYYSGLMYLYTLTENEKGDSNY